MKDYLGRLPIFPIQILFQLDDQMAPEGRRHSVCVPSYARCLAVLAIDCYAPGLVEEKHLYGASYPVYRQTMHARTVPR